MTRTRGMMGLAIVMVILLGGSGLFGATNPKETAAAAPAVKAAPAVQAAPAAAPVAAVQAKASEPEADGYVGMKVCLDCHGKQVKAFERTSHGHANDKRTPAAKRECETCHGPGADHTQDPKGLKPGVRIIKLGRKSPLSAAEKNAVCLECHRKGRQMWEGSAHENKGVSCTTCHNVHAGNEANLAKANQLDLCVGCHKQIKLDIQKVSHHPIREGKVRCNDCHNPHGTVSDKLISANSLNDKCYECHAEKRGPFLWEHAPVQENCATCHSPHGSSHERLLVQKRPYLCQSCHAGTRHPGTLYARNNATARNPDGTLQTVYQSVGLQAQYRACSNCHNEVHGSNHPSGQFFTR